MEDREIVLVNVEIEVGVGKQNTVTRAGRVAVAIGVITIDESVAIVNDIVYREGEAIADDLFLMKIGEDHLVFEYRGVPLTFDY